MAGLDLGRKTGTVRDRDKPLGTRSPPGTGFNGQDFNTFSELFQDHSNHAGCGGKVSPLTLYP